MKKNKGMEQNGQLSSFTPDEELHELNFDELLEIEGGIESSEQSGCGLGCFRGSVEES